MVRARFADLRRAPTPAAPLPSPETILRHLTIDAEAYAAMVDLMRFGYDQWRQDRLARHLAVPDAP